MKRRFEIRNKMGHGEVKAIVTIYCDMVEDTEPDLVAMDMKANPVAPIFILKMQPGFDHREVTIKDSE